MSQQIDLAKSTIYGTLWAYISRYSGKFLNFISIVILARLLAQEDFGVAGYALVAIGFLDINGLGVGSALVYYDEDRRRSNTGFWLAIAIGLGLFVVMWLAAPLAGLFFQDERSVPVIQALALTFPLTSLSVVPEALLFKNLAFSRRFVPDFFRGVSKGVVSIGLAWWGFGAWSLIIGQLAGTAMAVVAFWLVLPSNWRPALEFDRRMARPLLTYGSNIALVFVLGMLLLNIDYLLIGRYLGAVALGVYMLAFRIPELLIKQFYDLLGNVLFPIYTRVRDDIATLRRGFLTTMGYITMATIPMGLGLALVAKPLIITVFGEKWIEAATVVPAIAIYTTLRSIYFNSGSIYKARGRPDLLTKLHLFQLAILAPAVWAAVVYTGSIAAVGWTLVVVELVIGAGRLLLAARLVNAPYRTILLTLRPMAISGLFMAAMVAAGLQLTSRAPDLVQLMVGISVGVLAYSAAIWWLQREVVLVAGHKLRAAFSRR